MNIFMPEPTISKSVEALDDKRLLKQILECYQIVKINDRVLAGEEKVGYSHHPVVEYYRDKRRFVCEYGYKACLERWARTGKGHKYWDFFAQEENKYDRWQVFLKVCYIDKRPDLYFVESKYMYNIKSLPDVCKEFRQKLINKWNTDKKRPCWTGSECPAWYKKEEE